MPILEIISILTCSLFAGAAIYINLVVPFTFLVIMSTNKQLLDPERDRTTAETEWHSSEGVGFSACRPQHLEPAGGHLVCVSRRCYLSI